MDFREPTSSKDVRHALSVRPFETEADYAAAIGYFIDGGNAFLTGMGIDVAKLPTREEWLRTAMRDHGRSPEERDRFYLAWLYDGARVGQSSITHIVPGEEAHFHLHLWRADLRGGGIGTAFVRLSAAYYFARFSFARLISEPHAENPAPNRALQKAGFRFVKRYRTVPTPTSFEQDVNRYELQASP